MAAILAASAPPATIAVAAQPAPDVPSAADCEKLGFRIRDDGYDDYRRVSPMAGVVAHSTRLTKCLPTSPLSTPPAPA